MGGTFDSVHHATWQQQVRSRRALRPPSGRLRAHTGQSWQKGDVDVTPAEDRYLMTVIATAANPRFAVSPVDIDRLGLTCDVRVMAPARW